MVIGIKIIDCAKMSCRVMTCILHECIGVGRMSSGMIKTTIREIKASFGRYLAILAIVMLGVGLFAGLKITKPAMITTENAYLREQNFFDFRLLSTIGFTDDDVEKLSQMDDAADVEGTISLDALCMIKEGNEAVYKIHAIPEKINKVVLTVGRMPQAADECVLDSTQYTEEVIDLCLRSRTVMMKIRWICSGIEHIRLWVLCSLHII